METVALCPLAVGSVLWQPDATGWTLSAVVKGTFTLEHGKEPVLADAQDPIGGDRFFAGDRRASLAHASDLAPFKPRVDVSLVGHAYSPGMKPIDALVAKLSVGDLEKSVGLVGDRVWVEGPDGLEPAAPAPFVKMPLRWERAARAAQNPVGLDLTASPVGGALALPNLEPVEDAEGAGLAVGFGPIAPAWPARRRRLGPGHAAWIEDLAGPAPAGLDFGFFNSAPADQQIELLRYGSRIALQHLHPRIARLETRVPALRPKAFLVHARTGKAEEFALRCDTLAIDTDRNVLTLAWRGLCSIAPGDENGVGTLVVAIETKGKEIRYKQIEALVREGGLSSIGLDELATDERNPMSVRHDSVKPGGPAPPLIPARTPAEPPSRRNRRSSSGSGSDPGDRPKSDPGEVRAKAAPAKPEPPRPEPPRPGPARVENAAPAKRAPTDTAATEVKPLFEDEGTDASTQDDSTEQRMERDSAASSPPSGDGWRDVAGLAPTSVRGEDRICPFGFDVEHYAALSAALSQRTVPRKRVLSGAGVTEDELRQLEEHYTDAMEEDHHVAEAFRVALTEAMDRIRSEPSLPLATWARLVAALEAGDAAPILAELGIDADDVPAHRAEWTRRAQDDPELAKQIADAIESARGK